MGCLLERKRHLLTYRKIEASLGISKTSIQNILNCVLKKNSFPLDTASVDQKEAGVNLCQKKQHKYTDYIYQLKKSTEACIYNTVILNK